MKCKDIFVIILKFTRYGYECVQKIRIDNSGGFEEYFRKCDVISADEQRNHQQEPPEPALSHPSEYQRIENLPNCSGYTLSFVQNADNLLFGATFLYSGVLHLDFYRGELSSQPGQFYRLRSR